MYVARRFLIPGIDEKKEETTKAGCNACTRFEFLPLEIQINA